MWEKMAEVGVKWGEVRRCETVGRNGNKWGEIEICLFIDNVRDKRKELRIVTLQIRIEVEKNYEINNLREMLTFFSVRITIPSS